MTAAIASSMACPRRYSSVDYLQAAWRDAALGSAPRVPDPQRPDDGRRSTSRVMRFWTFRPDISFLPSPERLKPSEYGYYTWDYVWLVPGRETFFESINREWQR
ncbi:MAG: hypothetical protein M0C28_04895 [Candidatus Moduliflexus flocculans]|nr:hypothetical protein [Candidatus Moduliflexus flocculans]